MTRLLRLGADAAARTDADALGWTPLHVAAVHGMPAAAAALLRDPAADAAAADVHVRSSPARPCRRILLSDCGI